jgi:hypothetical protein
MQDWTRKARAALPARRSAQGIEITSREIRLIRLSCAAQETLGERTVCVEDVQRHALPPGTVVGADIVEVEVLARALAACLAQQAARFEQRAVPLVPPASMRENERHSARADAGTNEPGWFERGERVEPAGLAMALCPSVVIQREVLLDELMPGFRIQMPGTINDTTFDALEPWVRLYAQKMSGIDLPELLVDWYRSPVDARRIVIAAAQRHYLAVREQLAGAAGATLSALGDASAAALAACRFVISRNLHVPVDENERTALYPAPVDGARFAPGASFDASSDSASSGACVQDGVGRMPYEADISGLGGFSGFGTIGVHQMLDRQARSQRFAAIWIGEGVGRAWTFDANGTSLQPLPLPAARDAHDVLRALAAYRGTPLALALVAGELDLLDAVGGTRAVSATLGCPAIAFDASSCCVGPSALPAELGPASAVALGLALRELMR